MLWKGFQRPQRVEVDHDTLSATYGRFSAQPFERGFATTVGNALRRCLLSSIEGAAITAVQIEGVLHEFSSIPGAVQDMTDLTLNLKQIPIRLHSEEAKMLSLDIEGPGDVKASQLLGDSQVEICDPEAFIATINEEGHLKLQAQVRNGRGYVSAEQNFDESMGIGWIPLDSSHSPVRRVNYTVEAARVGRATDYERLVLEIWTNGTISPEEAASLASTLLRDHLTIFIEAEEAAAAEPLTAAAEPTGIEGLLAKTIDELDLSARSTNCLKNAKINTLRDLVRRSEKEMLETKNFGQRSLDEVLEVLDGFGLRLGMDVPDAAGSASA
ncbi:MAG: DNA-directed RNA polymerase subunit alpha [Acidobacteriota bacterium]|nr:DNA-directed RNA polymerase subunit alpha [Acidobacteriota bacterium]MDH3522700.1 DNA-directed RNA polymerase subunit alpha [Acidobacteriota bacterium]